MGLRYDLLMRVAFVVLVLATSALGQAVQLDNLNTTPTGSQLRALSGAQGRAYFGAFEPATGIELYRCDQALGTAALVSDFTPGPASSTIEWTWATSSSRAYVKVNGGLAVTTTGTGLTSLLPDVDQPLGALGGNFFFSRTVGATKELWRSNGTVSGTVLIPLGAPATRLRAGGSFGTTFYVFKDDLSMWRTDGTTAVSMTTTLNALPIPTFTAGATVAWFGLGGALFRINPTTQAVTLIRSFADGLQLGAALGDTVVFLGDDGLTGSELWRQSASTMVAAQIRDFTTGSGSSAFTSLVTVNGVVVFRQFGSSHVLWATDGTSAGTVSLATLPQSASFGPLPTLSSGLSFTFSQSYLTSTDGTPAGTSTLAFTSNTASVVAAGSTVFFVGADRHLWSTGSAGPPTQVGVLSNSTGPFLIGGWFSSLDESVGFIESTPVRLTGRPGGTTRWPNAALYGARGNDGLGVAFAAGAGSEPVLLRDGGQTTSLGDFTPGPNSTRITTSIDLGPVTLFTATPSISGVPFDVELARTDGTIAGTTMLLEVQPGPASSAIDAFTAIDGRAWFAADDGITGRELWLSDGSIMGTRLAVDLSPGVASSNPLHVTRFGTGALFTATTPASGTEAWFSDGTSAGTRLLVDAVPGTNSGIDTSFAGFCEAPTLGAFFVANGQLYRTNGTAAGTVVVGAAPDRFTCAGDRLVAIRDGGVEAFDGTATTRLTPLGFAFGFRPTSLASAGTTVFVEASTSFFGNELWKTAVADGGLEQVANIAPGAQSALNGLTSLRLRDRFVFMAANDGFDTEPWATPLDGTRPVITPTVSGPMGLNGWYVGDVAVSFAVVENDTRLARAGCDAVMVTSDTPGRTLRCRATSEGGEAEVVVTLKRDATPPLAPVATSPVSGSVTNLVRPTMGVTAPEPTTLRVRVAATTVCSSTAAAGQASCVPTSDFSEGPHTVSLTLTDEAGNESPVTSLTFTVDVTAPAAPTITTPAAAAVTNALQFAGTAEPLASVTVFDVASMTTLCSATADGAGAWSCLAPPTGSDRMVSVNAAARDVAGNVSGRSPTTSFSLDVTAPVPPSLTAPASMAVVGTATPTVQGTTEPGATVHVFVDGASTPSCQAISTVSGAFSCQVTTSLSDGPHSVTARSRDAAGNDSALSNPVSFTVASAAPPAPVITTPADQSTLRASRPGFSGTSAGATQVRVIVDGAAAPACVALPAGDGAWACTATDALAEGPHTAVAIAVGASANQSPPSASTRFTIDSSPPAAPVITSPPASATTGVRPTFAGTAEAGSSVALYFDGAVSTGCAGQASTTGSWSCVPAVALSVAQHTVQARATDAAGNESVASGVVLFTVQSSVDTRAPELSCPADIDAQASSGGSAIVNFQATVRDDFDPAPALRYSQAPGTDFLEGETQVLVTATDATGNTAQCAFLVKVGSSSERNTVRSGCGCSGAGVDALLSLGVLGLWSLGRRRRPR